MSVTVRRAQHVTAVRSDKLKWRGIVKVQRALNKGHDPGMAVCIYSEDRSIFYHSFMTQEIEKWFNGEVKFFARAELRGTIINLVRKAGWQEW